MSSQNLSSPLSKPPELTATTASSDSEFRKYNSLSKPSEVVISTASSGGEFCKFIRSRLFLTTIIFKPLWFATQSICIATFSMYTMWLPPPHWATDQEMPFHGACQLHQPSLENTRPLFFLESRCPNWQASAFSGVHASPTIRNLIVQEFVGIQDGRWKEHNVCTCV